MSELSCLKISPPYWGFNIWGMCSSSVPWWNNTTVYIFLNPSWEPIEKSILTIKFPWKYIHTQVCFEVTKTRKIWFQETGRELGLRRPNQAINGYSSRPRTKPIHPLRHLEKGERGKRWGRKNMRYSLFLAASINYSDKWRDRLTLAILFLVPLMTVVVNIHRQTPFLSLCSPSPPSQWQKYFNSFNQKICFSLWGQLIPLGVVTSVSRTLLAGWPSLFLSVLNASSASSQPFEVPMCFHKFAKSDCPSWTTIFRRA